MTWNPQLLPAQRGTTVLVTGANAGLGYFTSEQLARAGARVILSGRNPAKLAAAATAVRRAVPSADIDTLVIDVADLDSVRAGAATLGGRLDAVVLNAGIVHPPRDRTLSVDGHELVLATNVIGHVALADLTLPLLERTAAEHGAARFVWLGSIVTRLRDSDLTDLQLERSYDFATAYSQSKIAMQVFGFELDRRLRAIGSPVASIVAEPGYSIGGRTRRVEGVNEPSWTKRIGDNALFFLAQGKESGAWSQVRATLDPSIEGGEYWGPRFFTRGRPARLTPTRTSTDPVIARRVWRELTDAAGARFAELDGSGGAP
ncbi:SDR family NAD(P)-dependent oxidoreductase [Agromyces atrinae]|uniref:NAD(P)-dependent dehydrogenase (Short-subunit alcohol dehydrogenase family) n=1 Tax=Agromyces atrinae TaxID=592376 RepID=A0A4Q2M691_9MICO|nr:SDR family NAD(P)-dependent oxidoreductase [Agromyces atrinae]NYD68184.1 NAD(P)-dependent dehydrogenase (short-subunit alcohol dehydrogenase family) [Agromyces atrinae]RXZ87675.1 SDR family NAD(P)-dependent oxidoreductase [Agromyces atrinae]